MTADPAAAALSLVDFHVHAGPDARPRRCDAFDLGRAAIEHDVVGLVLKSHSLSTVGTAALLERARPGLRAAGGVALNHAVGGINPAAVEASIAAGGKVVWFPTQDAENDRRRTGAPGPVVTIRDAGSLTEDVHEVLRLCAETDQVVCSGHLDPTEVDALFTAAKAHGVERFVVSHPDHRHVDVPPSLQQELTARGALIERIIPREHTSTIGLTELVARIRAVGVERNILASDLGQPQNPVPAEGFRRFAEALADAGLTSQEMRTIGCRNACELLGWEVAS
ncbi:hypothetical protein DLE60_27755 [Micromonospora globispora]|uniref:DUF6282 family protein n=1 Tax=Micromonospora globispora TaxID=1450148 RepID=UPI000D6EDD31|nr:DUF6282 family protein [Micromonospora globispora]PWU55405.1 hypothetical protein DLE60_27755 [Micromonospora globispora]RQW91804.1 hypothetical protein DKL51_20125 [Micromonospora globispora]